MCFGDSPDPPPPPAAPPPPPPTLDQAAPDTSAGKNTDQIIGNAEGVKKYRTTGLGIDKGGSPAATPTGLGIAS